MSIQLSNIPKRRLSGEDIVIIIVIAFGFLGGLVILKMNFQPIIVSVLFGTGIASLVYRFLGGIENSTTIKLGPIKLVGALAALIGAAWIIDMKLEKQTLSMTEIAIEPPPHTWFGMKKDGSPVPVVIRKDTFFLPEEGLATNQLVLKYEDEQMKVYGENHPDFLLGIIGLGAMKNFEKGPLFNSFPNKVNNFAISKELNPESPPWDLSKDNMPFAIKVRSFENNKSYFQLRNPSDNTVLYESNINTRGAEIVNIDRRYFLIGIFSVSHQGKDKKHYARFLVGELSPELTME